MSNLLRFLFPSLCLVLIGCGVSTSSQPAPLPANVSGNWQFDLQLPVSTPPISLPTTPIASIFGSLTSSGKAVAAILHATPLANPHCVEMDTGLPFSGTSDGSGNISLTAPLAGGVATISANVGTPQIATLPDGAIRNLPFVGTYQVIGGSCAQTSIPLNVFPVSNITGTFTGTATPVFNTPGSNSTITATLTEAITPDANGKYALSGTITSTGGCNATYTFTTGAVSGERAQSSYTLSTEFSVSTSATPIFGPFPPIPVFLGNLTPFSPRPSLVGTFTFDGCSAQYTGSLTPTQ